MEKQFVITVYTLVVFTAAFYVRGHAAPAAETAGPAPGRSSGRGEKKALVVYYSRTGITKRVAEEIAARMGADCERITETKKRKGLLGLFGGGSGGETEISEPRCDIAEYETVIIGMPIWYQDMPPAMRTWFSRFRHALPQRIAYFTTAGATGPGDIAVKVEEAAGRGVMGYTGFVREDFKHANRERRERKLSRFLALFRQQAFIYH